MDNILMKWMEAILANDEASTDQELVEHFVANGVTEYQARWAVSKRGEMLRGAQLRQWQEQFAALPTVTVSPLEVK